MNKSFFTIQSDVTAGDLAAWLSGHDIQATCVQAQNVAITDVVGVDAVSGGAVCYVASEAAADQLATTTGAIVITKSELADKVGAENAVIVVDQPQIGFAHACAHLCSAIEATDPPQIDPTAEVSPSAVIGNGAAIGPHSVIEAGVVIAGGVTIGAQCVIKANCVISFAQIGDGVTLAPGCVIGDAGFGFKMTPTGPVLMPHVGIVRIGDGSMIGTNSVIHRGGLQDTVIGTHVMLDSFAHIAHNCVVGDRVVAAAQLGLAGSSHIGKDVLIGGQVGIGDHVTIGDGAVLTARSGITKDIPAGMTVAGFPAQEAGLFWRELAAVRGLLRRKKK